MSSAHRGKKHGRRGRIAVRSAATLFLGGAGALVMAPAHATPLPTDIGVQGHGGISASQLTARVHGALTAPAANTPATLRPAARAGAPSGTATGQDPQPSASGTVAPHIIGGTTTSISTAPWMVQLWYYDDKGTSDTSDDVGFFCGGTVVSPTKILTAAHCVSGYDWHNNGAIIYGTSQLPTTDPSTNTTDFHGGTVTGVWRQWNDSSFKITSAGTAVNDVAVLTLPNPISAKPLPITTSDDTTSYKAGTQAQIYGWGRTSSTNQDISQTLQKATVPVNADSTCSAYYGSDFVAGAMTCVGAPASGSDSGTVASCNGDSGGPLVVGGRVVGVVSWGVQDCVAQGSYSVFTKLSRYVGATEPRIDDTDLSGDGRADMFAIASNGQGYEYDSRGTSFGTRIPLGDWSGVNLVRQADLDRDGYADLLVRTTDGTLYWQHLNLSTGNADVTRIGSGWNAMKVMLAPGDVTGDGHQDLLTVDSSGNFWLYPGTGHGTFGSRVKLGYGWNTYGANIFGKGDFTGDGKLDLLAQDSSGNLWLYKGTGDPSHPLASRVKIGWGFHYTAYVMNGDMTGNGHSDLIARDSSGNLWLYQGTGDVSHPLASRVKIGYGYNGYRLS
ncbi:trypsin-like serine protease [Streptomyces camelliae]|uniref:Trypsin-like serine protease n=1 Tax=Streptomyces camelliae TaxID=3004093 RepID=A0ABY7P414_9ACTN|nr:trypsin-like serine protease [Streptomyces sp. HUAS 2-6]WBO65288.1 trypsin-like serine protease [Streptomyces sp. HUAS 2-6]